MMQEDELRCSQCAEVLPHPHLDRVNRGPGDNPAWRYCDEKCQTAQIREELRARKSAKELLSMPSPFASALHSLLDDTNMFGRNGWARYLGVTTDTLTRWVADREMPRPDQLRMVLSVLRESEGVPLEPLLAWDDMAVRFVFEVSPLGGSRQPTMREYVLRSSPGEVAQGIQEKMVLPPLTPQELEEVERRGAPTANETLRMATELRRLRAEAHAVPAWLRPGVGGTRPPQGAKTDEELDRAFEVARSMGSHYSWAVRNEVGAFVRWATPEEEQAHIVLYHTALATAWEQLQSLEELTRINEEWHQYALHQHNALAALEEALRGRAEPPTDADIDQLAAEGGFWYYLYRGHLPTVLRYPEPAKVEAAGCRTGDVPPGHWYAADARGKMRAWPVPPTVSKPTGGK